MKFQNCFNPLTAEKRGKIVMLLYTLNAKKRLMFQHSIKKLNICKNITLKKINHSLMFQKNISAELFLFKKCLYYSEICS